MFSGIDTMGFYVDLEKISMDDYREILKAADLLPSRMILKEDMCGRNQSSFLVLM